jgi:hypothetical protein
MNIYIYIPISRKLDEEQSKHAGLAHHKNSSGPAILLLMMLRLLKGILLIL